MSKKKKYKDISFLKLGQLWNLSLSYAIPFSKNISKLVTWGKPYELQNTFLR